MFSEPKFDNEIDRYIGRYIGAFIKKNNRIQYIKNVKLSLIST